ncbi:MAG: hypothetical protein ACK4Q5_20465 [Saprospiraceae bacterium]
MRLKLLIFSLFSSFVLAAQSHADCTAAMDICKKQVYHIEKTGGEGADKKEADFISCFMNGENFGQAEENSTWFKFEIEKSGSLTFAITPHRLDDDIDFVVFKLPKDGNCQHKQIVRCCAAGDSHDTALSSPCMGETGLRAGEKASSRDAGCSDVGDNAWLAPLKVEKGEKYALLVSNVSSSGPGFSIRFGGTAKLPCDEEKTPPPPPKPEQKPKPKPKPAEPKPQPTAIAQLPAKTGDRENRVKTTITVKNYDFAVDVWDNQVEDGDVISLYLNDKKVVNSVRLTKKPQTFLLKMEGKEGYLTVFAEDFGKAEPNTASITIRDGNGEQTIKLLAAREFQETIKIVKE